MNPLGEVLQTQAALQKAAPQLAKLSKACEGLEQNFLQTMVSQMREGTGDVHFGEQFGGDVFDGMLNDTLAGILAQKNALGVSKAMYTPLASKVLQQARIAVKAQMGKTMEEPTH